MLTVQQSVIKKFYPWLAIFVSALFLFYKYILQVSPSVMANALMKAFHVHGAGLGNLAATFFYSYLVTQLFVGVLLDRYSLRCLATIAILFAAIGTYFFSMAETLLSAEVSRMAMGVGAAFATVSYMKVAALWFPPSRFAFVGGLLTTAAMLGAVFGETPLSLLIDKVGWRHGLLFCAILGCAIALLFFTVIRDKQQSTDMKIKSKSDKGALFRSLMQIFRNKQNWIITLYSGLSFAPIAVFGGLWGNPFLEEAYHLSRTTAASCVSLVFIGLALGGPALGFASDYFQNRRAVMFLGTGVALLSIAAVIYINALPIWVLLILLFCFGFGTGVFMLGFAIAKEINPIALTATVIALVNTGDAIFGAYTEPLVGELLDVGWSGKKLNGIQYFSLQDYHWAFSVLPIYLLLACIAIFFIRTKPPQYC